MWTATRHFTDNWLQKKLETWFHVMGVFLAILGPTSENFRLANLISRPLLIASPSAVLEVVEREQAKLRNAWVQGEEAVIVTSSCDCLPVYLQGCVSVFRCLQLIFRLQKFDLISFTALSDQSSKWAKRNSMSKLVIKFQLVISEKFNQLWWVHRLLEYLRTSCWSQNKIGV